MSASGGEPLEDVDGENSQGEEVAGSGENEVQSGVFVESGQRGGQGSLEEELGEVDGYCGLARKKSRGGWHRER